MIKLLVGFVLGFTACMAVAELTGVNNVLREMARERDEDV